MRNKIFSLLIYSALCISCSSEKELTKPYVIPYNETKEAPLFLYNLPATMLEVLVTVKQTQEFRGHYSDHAKRYLGLDPESIIQRDSKYFEIIDIQINTQQIQDSSQWYAYIHNPLLIPTFTLDKKNSLLGLNAITAQKTDADKKGTVNPEPKEINRFFYDIAMQKIADEEIQTVYRHVKRDSTIIKVPVQETVKTKKSEEEMARLAAEFITKIKNLRFELVAGLYEAFPEGRSLEASIKELYATENRYIELFTGKSADTTYTYSFTFTPESNIVTPFYKVLCYFDNEDGITIISPKQQYSNNNKNQQLRIEIDYANFHPIINQKIYPGGPVYRIPALCNVLLSKGDKTLFSTKTNINQLGSIYQLPADIIKHNTNKILFEPETGNISIIEAPLAPIEKRKK